MNFKQETKTKVTQTASGRTVRATNSTTRWSVTIQMPVRTVTEHKTLQGFVALAQGPLNDFEIVLPEVSYSSSAVASTLICNTIGNHNAGRTDINIYANYNNTTILKQGDVIKFGDPTLASHSKVYMVTTDINTDSAGYAILNIQPGLIEYVANSTPLTTNAVPFKMALNNDVQEYNYRVDGYVDYEMDLVEVFA